MACHDHTGLLAHLQTFLPAELVTALARKHGWFERERKLALGVAAALRSCAHARSSLRARSPSHLLRRLAREHDHVRVGEVDVRVFRLGARCLLMYM